MTGTLLHELSVRSGMGPSDLLRIILTAPIRYKTYEIRKRSGGSRTIAQPSRELKTLQRYISERILSKCPTHPAATGYTTGTNIKDNASAHVHNRVIIKLDFKDFFPSITVSDWHLYAKRQKLSLTAKEVDLCGKILFWHPGLGRPMCLSIGAPTSPILSNILLFDFDAKTAKAAEAANVVYTRYADDITASGKDVESVLRFERSARSIICRMRSPSLTFNEDKRGVYTSGQRRIVTGLILTPDQRVSMGRDRKRQISSMVHKVIVGERDIELIASLKGLLAFSISVEPSFLSSLRRKYGNTVIDNVLRFHIPSRDRSGDVTFDDD